jgi:ATP-binding cassette subfamily B multidrug efflux pump
MKKIISKKKNTKSTLIDNKRHFLFLDEQDESRVEETSLGDFKSIKVLYEYAKSFRLEIAISLSLIFSSSLTAILSAKFMGQFIEDGLMKKNFQLSIAFAFLIIILEALSIFFVWAGRMKLSSSASKLIYIVRGNLFKKLQKIPLEYFDRIPQGRIVTRLTSDVEGIEEFFTSSLGNFISAVMTTIIAVLAMLVTNFKIGSIMALSMIPSLIVMFITKDYLRQSNRRISKFSSAINAKQSEYISGLEVIRSNGLEEWSKKNFFNTVDDYLKAQLKGNVLFAWSMPLVIFCATIPLIGLIWFGGLKVLSQTLSLGVFISFIRYYERFFNPMMLLSREIHVIQQAFTSTERVMSFLNEKEEDKVLFNTGNMQLSKIDGEIQFFDVSMSYKNEEWILKNLSFHINAGEKIGLVGKTGCGKSSMVSLICRLYEFQLGEIFIDGISIRNIDRHILRDKIGMVSQDAVLFKGTLRENLISRPNQSDQELIDASKETGLINAISSTGFNLDMQILDAGTNLSAGEKQLVSLTRVLLRDPSILILDEATANIDPHYEEIIHRAVMKVMINRTCLIIAHRLDTLKECDRILVFDKGHLIEEGPLVDLIDQKKHFYHMHNIQTLH